MIKNYLLLPLSILFFVNLNSAQAQVNTNWWSSSYNNSNTSVTTSTSLPKINYTAENDSNSNGISDSVDAAISKLVNDFGFTPEKKSALEQVARSYTYTLMLAPNNSAAALDINLRDVAATRCLESRIPASNLDIVVERIEAASLNTNAKQNTYNRYIDLLGDQAPNVISNSSCEDSFVTEGEEDVFLDEEEEFMGDASHSASALPCLVLREFMTTGSSGEQVIKLQTFLVLTNYMYVWPTGHFGPNTAQALNDFQEDNSIDNSRPWAGPVTRAKIAEITCGGDASAMSAARNGYTVKKAYTQNTSAAPVVSAPLVKNNITTKDSSLAVIEIATTTRSNVNNSSTQTQSASSILPSVNGAFDLTKTSVTPLYFTVKSSPKTSDLYVCPAPIGADSCSNSNSYSLVRTRYDANTYDSIPGTDRWMFTIYYDPTVWSKGGRIYFKTSLSAPAYYYDIGVVK